MRSSGCLVISRANWARGAVNVAIPAGRSSTECWYRPAFGCDGGRCRCPSIVSRRQRARITAPPRERFLPQSRAASRKTRERTAPGHTPTGVVTFADKEASSVLQVTIACVGAIKEPLVGNRRPSCRCPSLGIRYLSHARVAFSERRRGLAVLPVRAAESSSSRPRQLGNPYVACPAASNSSSPRR